MEMNTSIKAAKAVVLAASLFGAMTANADMVTYDLELNNLTPYNGQTLARVTLTDIFSGTDIVGVNFKVEALITGSTLGQFAFNFVDPPNTAPTGFTFDTLPNGWSSAIDIDNITGFNGFGKFDAAASTTGASDRLSTLDFNVSFTANAGNINSFIGLSSGDPSEPSLFSVHVFDLGAYCGQYGNTVCTGYAGGGTIPPQEVPVPAAVWLFGSGLFGIVAVARRKRAAGTA